MKGLLTSARATAAVIFLAGLCAAAFCFDQPLVLGALLVGLMAIAVVEGIWRPLRGWLLAGLTVALLVAAINPLVSREGLTLLVQGPVLPAVGRLDITLEATVYGLLIGLRVLVVFLVFAIFQLAVDADQLLLVMQRVSFRSALTASLTTRLVPLLRRDAARLSDASRCRAPLGAVARGDGPIARTRARGPVLAALVAGSLERATDIAAALEVRGFGATKPRRAATTPWTWSDIVLLVAGILLIAIALGGLLAGLGQFQTYPTLGTALGPGSIAIALGVLALAIAPLLAAGLRRLRLPNGRELERA